MSTDLLARIAKALEEYQANGDRVAESILGIEAYTLLPECAAALTIAVEALEKMRVHFAVRTHIPAIKWAADELDAALDKIEALSRLTSATEAKGEPIPKETCSRCGQPRDLHRLDVTRDAAGCPCPHRNGSFEGRCRDCGQPPGEGK